MFIAAMVLIAAAQIIGWSIGLAAWLLIARYYHDFISQ